MEFVGEGGKQLQSDCSTLVLPALSIGNVGQLAVDLLVCTTKAKRIGFLDDPFVLPCVGNDAFGPLPSGELTLPLEVYESSLHKLTFVQQRSPVTKGMMVEFAKNMADFAVAAGKKHVVILSSIDFSRWKRIDMSSGLKIHYLSSANSCGIDDNCEKHGWKMLQECLPGGERWLYLNAAAEGNNFQEWSKICDDDVDSDEDYYASLPFAALFSCLKARGLKVTCLLGYCSEGDNINDSMNLADAACKLLGLRPSSSHEGGWIVPLSWQSVYGPPPDLSMF